MILLQWIVIKIHTSYNSLPKTSQLIRKVNLPLLNMVKISTFMFSSKTFCPQNCFIFSWKSLTRTHSPIFRGRKKTAAKKKTPFSHTHTKITQKCQILNFPKNKKNTDQVEIVNDVIVIFIDCQVIRYLWTSVLIFWSN